MLLHAGCGACARWVALLASSLLLASTLPAAARGRPRGKRVKVTVQTDKRAFGVLDSLPFRVTLTNLSRGPIVLLRFEPAALQGQYLIDIELCRVQRRQCEPIQTRRPIVPTKTSHAFEEITVGHGESISFELDVRPWLETLDDERHLIPGTYRLRAVVDDSPAGIYSSRRTPLRPARSKYKTLEIVR